MTVVLLGREDTRVARCTVERLMRRAGLQGARDSALRHAARFVEMLREPR